MTDFIIETSQLTKSFKGQQALGGLDLEVPRGASTVSWAAMARAKPQRSRL